MIAPVGGRRALGSYITTSPGRMCGVIDPDVTVTGRRPIISGTASQSVNVPITVINAGRDRDEEQRRAAHEGRTAATLPHPVGRCCERRAGSTGSRGRRAYPCASHV